MLSCPVQEALFVMATATTSSKKRGRLEDQENEEEEEEVDQPVHLRSWNRDMPPDPTIDCYAHHLRHLVAPGARLDTISTSEWQIRIQPLVQVV